MAIHSQPTIQVLFLSLFKNKKQTDYYFIQVAKLHWEESSQTHVKEKNPSLMSISCRSFSGNCRSFHAYQFAKIQITRFPKEKKKFSSINLSGENWTWFFLSPHLKISFFFCSSLERLPSQLILVLRITMYWWKELIFKLPNLLRVRASCSSKLGALLKPLYPHWYHNKKLKHKQAKCREDFQELSI